MANQPHNPQQQDQQRKPFGNQSEKRAPGQQGKPGAGRADQNRPSPQPQDPADLGHDPRPDNIQAGRMGQSSEKH